MYAIRLKQKIDGKYMYVCRVSTDYRLMPDVGSTWKTLPTVKSSAGSAIVWTLYNSITRNYYNCSDTFDDAMKKLGVVFPVDRDKWPSREQVFNDLLEVVKVEFKEV